MRGTVRPIAIAAALATVALAAVGGTAGAVTGSFAATCTMLGDETVPPTHRAISYEVHAPDSVDPGASVDVGLTFGYAIPRDALIGGANIDFGGPGLFSVIASPSASEVTGTVHTTADGGPGSVVPVRLDNVGWLSRFPPPGFVGEQCIPDHTLVLTRIGVGVPQVSVGDVAVVEGSTGARAVEFPVTLSRPAATNVTVAYDTGDGTATAGSDYDATSGVVTIRAGALTGLAEVQVHGDSVVEPKENFHVRLRDPSGAVVGRRVGTGRIIDDDPESGSRLSIGDGPVVEGRLGDRAALVTVSLSAPLTHAVTFHYTTIAGTADAGTDYRSQSFDAAIAAGQTSIPIAVPVLGDATAEGTESFTVRLSGVTGATLGRTNGVGKILDDD